MMYEHTDLDGTNLQVAAVVQASLEQVVSDIVRDIAKQQAIEAAIPGIRQQIIANITLLLPIIRPKQCYNCSVTTHAGDDDSDSNASAADIVQVVTLGEPGKVRACVFTGATSYPKKLLHSAESSDTVAALSDLLNKSECMIATHFGYPVKAPAKRAKVLNQAPITAAPVCDAPATSIATQYFENVATHIKEAAITKLKAEAKTKAKHARNSSIGANIGLWTGSINNSGFMAECGDPSGKGRDSGFLSRDGEPHPNRSYVKLNAMVAAAAGPTPQYTFL